jgi:Ulp1 protease family, C-terminal catalytic domain
MNASDENENGPSSTQEVKWIKTVEQLVQSRERGGSTIKSEILCEVTKDESKVLEVCDIVAEWNNHITSEALYCFDSTLDEFRKGLTKNDLEDLINFKPGHLKDFKNSDDLNEWIEKNQKIQDSLENMSVAARYLARLKKYQILEQIFSNQNEKFRVNISKDQKTRLKWEYLLMKFAVENHSLGLDVFRFVNTPWSKFSKCKEFRQFVEKKGLEFPLVAENSSRIKEIQDPPQEEFVCTQDFRAAISDRDLRTLGNKKWVNDQIISHYGAHIITNTSRTDIYFVHSTVFAMGSQARLIPVGNSFKVFAISANLQNQHWALVLVHLEQQKIYYLDSWPQNRKYNIYHEPTNLKKDGTLKYKVRSVVSRIEQKHLSIRQLVESILKANGCVIEKFEWVECSMPMQQNGCDCGVFILKYLEDFVENEVELVDAWNKGDDLRSRYTGVNFNDYRDSIRSILQ